MKMCRRLHLKNPLVHKMSTLNNPLPPLTADVFYGQPLISLWLMLCKIC